MAVLNHIRGVSLPAKSARMWRLARLAWPKEFLDHLGS